MYNIHSGIHYYSIPLAVDCGGLTNPSNGAVDTSSGTTFMMTATYTCNTGYTPTGGNITRTCQATLMWSGAALTCDGEYVIAKF